MQLPHKSYKKDLIKNIEEIPYILDIAYDIANNGKKGAVHIDLPKDISSSIFTNTLSWKNEIKLTKLYNESINKDILNSKVDKSKNSKKIV